jgi:hypothetical protein
MKNALIACAFLSAFAFTPAFADTAGPTQAEAAAALQADPIAPVSDIELRNYAGAQTELDGLYPAPPLSASQMTRVRLQTSAALQRHNLSATRYNEITTALDMNAQLAQRFAMISHTQAPGV